MNKFGLYNDRNSVSFDSHLEGLKDEAKSILVTLRTTIKSFGSNVIEEVRPHRIVYAKSLTFRYFADVRPLQDSIIISIKKNRTESAKEYTVKRLSDINQLEQELKDAYLKI